MNSFYSTFSLHYHYIKIEIFRIMHTSVHLVCFSPTHSSHIIGEQVIKGMEMEDWSETDLTYHDLASPLHLKNTVVIITVPVYGGRVAETAMERLEQVWGEQSLAIPVVVYGNRDYEDALLELRDWCLHHGFTPIAAAAFIGEHSYSRPDRPIAAGRPDENDQEVAHHFGSQIRQLLNQLPSPENIPTLQVKGNYPYKQKGPHTPQAPLTLTECCSGCGFCASICPTEAITIVENIAHSDINRCIKCCACVKQCPTEARQFDTPFTDYLFQNFSTPKKPELYILKPDGDSK